MKYNDRAVIPWLIRMARKGIRLGGVSGGPLVLARAGLMNGRRMTVHWEHAELLAEISPHLMIERSLYVIDRDRVTCAGGTAPMDLMHALIARHHGAALCPAGQAIGTCTPKFAPRSARNAVGWLNAWARTTRRFSTRSRRWKAMSPNH